MTNYIGIDLGTTFSAIAYVNEHGVPEVIENSEGERTTPSVILFDGTEVHVGSYAKDNMSVYPGQGVEFVKRYMGDKLWSFEYNGRMYNASEISSFILKKLKEDAEAKLETSIKDVVITVPAYFGAPQRRATIEAGELAGLNVVQVINEPTAAAYSYGLHKLGKDQRILVFDLGGGTFDVTVMEITGERIEVKATNGDHQLGGKDWDEELIQYIAEKFERAYQINPYSYEADYQTLKEKALAAKISLSTLPKANINYGCKGKILKEEITRQQFEEITSRLVNQCRMLTELVLNEAGFKAADIDIVLLAGGSTRMPMVVEMLKRYFGKDPSKALNPDECVALGASVKAAFLKKEKWFLPGEKKTWALPSGMKDINVTSHSFGLAVLNEGELYNSIIIPKNSPYPCDLEKSDYVTSYDDQETLDVYVLEGEAEDPRDCELVGSYQIYDIPKRPEGKARLKMTYKYNENQIVEVSAVDLHSNKVLPIRMIENPDLNELASSGIHSLKIAVTRPGYDNIGEVLRKLEYEFETINDMMLSDIKNLSYFNVVFINCGSGGNPLSNSSSLKKFVENGGILYVSDLAAPQIASAFTDVIGFAQGGNANQWVEANVTDLELQKIVGKTIKIFFNAPGWQYVQRYSEKVKVLLKGKFSTSAGIIDDTPILISFVQGKGEVIYTSFHNHAQADEKQEMLLNYLVLRSLSSATKIPVLKLAKNKGLMK